MNDETPSPLPQPTGSHGHSVVYMLRTTQQHHVALSALADQKASFLLAASVLLLGIVLSQVMKGHAPPALLVLGGTALLTTLMASMSLMPRTTVRTARAAKPNLLFFGHFTGMTEAEYLTEMRRIFTSDEAVFEAMARDIYQMGSVLRHKKFRYLGLCYGTFVGGIIATGLTASVGWLLQQG